MGADAFGFTFAPSTRQIASGSLVTSPVGCPPAILTGGCSETKRLAGSLKLDPTAETVTIEGKVLVTVVRRVELLGGGGDH